MKLNNMHMFMIICFAAIISVLIFFVIPIWACSLAAFIGIIALAYMINDFLDERSAKRDMIASGARYPNYGAPLEEDYPGWEHAEEAIPIYEDDTVTARPQQKKVVLFYMELFGLDEERAVNLYEAGFKNITRLRRVSHEELVTVPGINPTLARRILSISKKKH